MSTVADPNNTEASTIFTKLANGARTKLWADLLRQLPDLVSKLEEPSSSWTIWAPCNTAIRDLTSKSQPLPTEIIKHLAYSLITPLDVPTSVLAHFPNVPVLEAPTYLNGQQVLRTRPIYLPHLGPTFSVNFNSHILEANIVASNGTIHVINIAPEAPDTVVKVLNALPAASFSILQRAIETVSFHVDLSDLEIQGCTFFAPINAAFAGVGVHVATDLDNNADDESLRGLLSQHFCPNQTLYSNRYYDGKSDSTTTREEEAIATATAQNGSEIVFRKGVRSFSLMSAAPNRSMIVDVNRYGGLIDMRVNGKAGVLSADHIASNGVVHLIDHLI